VIISPVKDLVLADVNLEGHEFDLFRSICDRTSGSCPPPDFAVFLHLESDHLLERLAACGRPFEVGFEPSCLEAIDKGYLGRHGGTWQEGRARVAFPPENFPGGRRTGRQGMR
jgi:deoxyadenosine/deoxycytidine kinase